MRCCTGQAPLALAFRKDYPRNPGHPLFSLGRAQRDVEHLRFARAHGGHVGRDFTRTRIVLFKHNRAGGLREDNVRKRTARQARQFGLASTSEFAFDTALTSPARNVVFSFISLSGSLPRISA
jgi:hypothetical protein